MITVVKLRDRDHGILIVFGLQLFLGRRGGDLLLLARPTSLAGQIRTFSASGDTLEQEGSK